MTRTIVLSDAHGYPALIRNALAHSGFVAGVDHLVFAGDFVDRGDRPQDCLDLIEGVGAQVLWGNHDLAVLFERFIYPCSGESRSFRPLFLERFHAGAWQLAACIDGVLITHAGLSADYADEWEVCGREPAKLASRLNDEFRAVAGYLVESGRKDGARRSSATAAPHGSGRHSRAGSASSPASPRSPVTRLAACPAFAATCAMPACT